MADIIAETDLPAALQGGDLVGLMVDGANAKASRVAPCLVSLDPAPSAGQIAEAKLILVGAVKRWFEAGSGAVSQQTAGPFGVTVDTRQKSSGFNLWPSEIVELQEICKTGDEPTRAAFSIDTAGPYGVIHAEGCSLFFGATYCDCGADIAGFPLFESS